MKLTREQIEKIALLARLKISPEEAERYANQLTDILSYVEVISELDTSNVKESSQVTGLSSVSRPDEVDAQMCEPHELLECSPLPKMDDQIKIKRMM